MYPRVASILFRPDPPGGFIEEGDCSVSYRRHFLRVSQTRNGALPTAVYY